MSDRDYKIGGVKLPGVTTILKEVGAIDTRWAQQWHLDRGTAVHKTIELHNKGVLDYDSIDPEVTPYFEQWLEFENVSEIKVLTSEKKVTHETLLYGGTLDMIAELNGEKVLIDLKTGGKAPWHSLQTAAYAMAYLQSTDLKLPPYVKRFTLYLSGEGMANLSRHENDEQDCFAFQGFLSVFNWLTTTGAIKTFNRG